MRLHHWRDAVFDEQVMGFRVYGVGGLEGFGGLGDLGFWGGFGVL